MNKVDIFLPDGTALTYNTSNYGFTSDGHLQIEIDNERIITNLPFIIRSG